MAKTTISASSSLDRLSSDVILIGDDSTSMPLLVKKERGSEERRRVAAKVNLHHVGAAFAAFAAFALAHVRLHTDSPGASSAPSLDM